MRLVDDEKAGGGGQFRQDVVAEVGVVEPLRADQQHVHRARGDLGADGLPLLGVGGVDGPGVDVGSGGGVDLVAHEREQRGDDHGRSGAVLPQQGRRHEVHRGLAPPRALHDQGAALVGDQCLDGSPLVLAQPRRSGAVPDEPGEDPVSSLAQLGLARVRHASHTTGRLGQSGISAGGLWTTAPFVACGMPICAQRI